MSADTAFPAFCVGVVVGVLFIGTLIAITKAVPPWMMKAKEACEAPLPRTQQCEIMFVPSTVIS